MKIRDNRPSVIGDLFWSFAFATAIWIFAGFLINIWEAIHR